MHGILFLENSVYTKMIFRTLFLYMKWSWSLDSDNELFVFLCFYTYVNFETCESGVAVEGWSAGSMSPAPCGVSRTPAVGPPLPTALLYPGDNNCSLKSCQCLQVSCFLSFFEIKFIHSTSYHTEFQTLVWPKCHGKKLGKNRKVIYKKNIVFFQSKCSGTSALEDLWETEGCHLACVNCGPHSTECGTSDSKPRADFQSMGLITVQ